MRQSGFAMLMGYPPTPTEKLAEVEHKAEVKDLTAGSMMLFAAVFAGLTALVAHEGASNYVIGAFVLLTLACAAYAARLIKRLPSTK